MEAELNTGHLLDPYEELRELARFYISIVTTVTLVMIMACFIVDPHAALPTLFPGHLWRLIEWSLRMHGMVYVTVGKSLGLYQVY